MCKKTDHTDKIISITLAISFLTFWVQIICAFVGDRNIVAPWTIYLYLLSTLVLMCTVIDKKDKWAVLRVLGGAVLLWGILIILYIGILAIRGFL